MCGGLITGVADLDSEVGVSKFKTGDPIMFKKLIVLVFLNNWNRT